MTKNQLRLRELRARQSTERGRMAELGMAESLDDETRSELDKIEQGVPDLERQIRAATVAVDGEQDGERRAVSPEDDAEARELRERVGMGEYVAAAAEQRSADGAAKEYNQALGISGNRFPLAMLAPAEERAVTGVDTTTMPTRWIDRLFASSAAMNVGVTMDTVAPGVSSHPVTATGASAAQRGKTEAAVDSAWTISVVKMKPKRNAVRLEFSIEDTARIPGLEAALTRDLRFALAEGIDRAIFLGDNTASGTDSDIVGLSTATGLTAVEITQTNKVKPAETLARGVYRVGRRDSRKRAWRFARCYQRRRVAIGGRTPSPTRRPKIRPWPRSCARPGCRGWRAARSTPTRQTAISALSSERAGASKAPPSPQFGKPAS